MNDNEKKKLLILGGNQYNVSGIQEARKADFFTIVADRNPQAPGLAEADIGLPIDLFDYEKLLKAIDGYGGVDGIISMAEAGVRPAAYLSKRLGLPSISQEAAANATSKAAMRHKWRKIGKYSVEYDVVNTEEQALQAINQLGRFPVIFKPDRSFGGARGVSLVDNKNQVHKAFLFAKSGALPNSNIVIERFVTGTEHSAEVLTWKGQSTVLCIGQKVKSPLPYRVDVSVQYPAQLAVQHEKVISDMCYEAIKALGLNQGIAHIEFVNTQNGPVLLELGARCGGGHTPQIAHHVSGVNEFIEACRMSCGIQPLQPKPTSKKGADYRFLIFPPGKIAGFSIPDRVQQHKNILDIGITLKTGDILKSLCTTSERAGYVVSIAGNRKEASEIADWTCKQVSITYDDGSISLPYNISNK
ncbi:ATP-grasp domain-containing protein [candidate division CSSED10-310 bacterium]|uniref:ATP-grasp domain-containing protein n=1 Tax=candidate division CSSED10-310 bacterium TaxID=2855610 RepID=A0ABV6YUX1_UNCC1